MRNILIVIIVLLPFSLKGQEVIDSIIKSDKNQISIGLIFSPDYCFRTLNNNDGSSSSTMIIDLRNEMEEPVFGFTAGLNVYYRVTENVGLEAGMHYSRQGYQLRKNDLYFGDPIDPRYGYSYDTASSMTPTGVRFISNYNYLDVPLRVVLKFGKNRMRFITSAGLTTNILVNSGQISILKYKDSRDKRSKQEFLHDIKTMNITATLGAGVEYNLNSKLFFRVEPTFRYGLLEINDDPITASLWRAGFAFGCYYNLR
jgi:hypothetical protein